MTAWRGSREDVEGSPLRLMLAPRSVAVVGAGRRHGGAGHETLRALRDYGFHGRLYAVNRSGRPVASVPAYRAVTELPGPVDLLMIAVPAGDVTRVLPVFHEPEQALRALAHARNYAVWRREPLTCRAGLGGVRADPGHAAIRRTVTARPGVPACDLRPTGPGRPTLSHMIFTGEADHVRP